MNLESIHATDLKVLAEVLSSLESASITPPFEILDATLMLTTDDGRTVQVAVRGDGAGGPLRVAVLGLDDEDFNF